jgi:hypothetical protein
MTTIATLREFNTRNFTVRVTAEPDYDIDLSFDDTGEVTEKLNSGEYLGFCVKAAVEYQGKEIATDYLGGCIHESFDAFMDHRECGKQNREYAARGEKGRCGSYFHDMIREVCSQARKEIATLKSVTLRAA